MAPHTHMIPIPSRRSSSYGACSPPTRSSTGWLPPPATPSPPTVTQNADYFSFAPGPFIPTMKPSLPRRDSTLSTTSTASMASMASRRDSLFSLCAPLSPYTSSTSLASLAATITTPPLAGSSACSSQSDNFSTSSSATASPTTQPHTPPATSYISDDELLSLDFTKPAKAPKVSSRLPVSSKEDSCAISWSDTRQPSYIDTEALQAAHRQRKRFIGPQPVLPASSASSTRKSRKSSSSNSSARKSSRKLGVIHE